MSERRRVPYWGDFVFASDEDDAALETVAALNQEGQYIEQNGEWVPVTLGVDNIIKVTDYVLSSSRVTGVCEVATTKGSPHPPLPPLLAQPSSRSARIATQYPSRRCLLVVVRLRMVAGPDDPCVR